MGDGTTTTTTTTRLARVRTVDNEKRRIVKSKERGCDGESKNLSISDSRKLDACKDKKEKKKVVGRRHDQDFPRLQPKSEQKEEMV